MAPNQLHWWPFSRHLQLHSQTQFWFPYFIGPRERSIKIELTNCYRRTKKFSCGHLRFVSVISCSVLFVVAHCLLWSPEVAKCLSLSWLLTVSCCSLSAVAHRLLSVSHCCSLVGVLTVGSMCVLVLCLSFPLVLGHSSSSSLVDKTPPHSCKHSCIPWLALGYPRPYVA